MTPTVRKPLYESETVIKAVRLLVGPGRITELRALEATTANDRRPHTASGTAKGVPGDRSEMNYGFGAIGTLVSASLSGN